MARKNPRRNISRIETTSANCKTYGGWDVRIQRRGRKMEKFFSDLGLGGKRAALQAAKEHRDRLELRHKKFSVSELADTPSTNNRSGLVGVRLHQQIDRRGEFEYSYWYWVAQWTDRRGRRKTRSFSVHKYGDDEACRLACESREQGLRKARR